MKTHTKRCASIITLWMMIFQILPVGVFAKWSDELIYPIKEISKLECRFQDFDTLASNCKRDLPILNSKDYNKYATKNGWYNDFTRIYTVLWGSSYKYGWDVGSGWHQGTDIATAKGTPVYSIADWVVIESDSDVGWGNYVSIEHEINGQKIISNYAHLATRDVKKWDKVDVWDKIGGVGSTGNSTGNHLHFQIDLPSIFHPYYYDYKKCPYGYYEITEKGVCFDELQENTYDPLVFLENNGVVDNRERVYVEENTDKQEQTKDNKTEDTSVKNTKTTSNSSSYDDSIFHTYVSPEDGTRDQVKQVQRVYNKLWYYTWNITWDYDDVYESIIQYQLDTWVVSSRTDLGAGYFGPKTRSQTKTDYDVYVASGGQTVLQVSTTPKKSETKETSKVEKTQTVKTVSRENLMTREEREAKEVQDFLEIYNIDIKQAPSHMQIDDTKISTLSITNKKGKAFRGNTPGNVSFSYDTNKMSVFPESFYNFTNGEREIYISGKWAGNTTLSVKIWESVVKTFSITVWEQWATIIPESAKIYMPNETVVWDDNTAIILMKDGFENNLIRTQYTGEFILHSTDEIEYCVKRGELKDIKSIYRRSCYPEEYTNSLSFDYDDTIAGLLIFDYKVLSTNSNTTLSLRESTKGTNLSTNILKVAAPKWLTANYKYYDEVLQTLELWISDGIKKWYFLEERELTQTDAKRWIRNTLRNTWDTVMEAKVVSEIPQSHITLSRQQFLELTHSYLWEEKNNSLSRTYRDMDEDNEVMVASLLWTDYEWNDDFGENYFQPDKKITRWEAAYLLTQALENTGQSYLVRK